MHGPANRYPPGTPARNLAQPQNGPRSAPIAPWRAARIDSGAVRPCEAAQPPGACGHSQGRIRTVGQYGRGESTEGEADIHHDRIVEKLEIARTMGLLTDYRVGPIGKAPRADANVTVWPSANAPSTREEIAIKSVVDG